MTDQDSAPRAGPPAVVAIDGPGGAGKSSVSQEVARRLGFLYVDTGALYRAITLKALRLGVSPDDAGLAALAGATEIALAQPQAGGPQRVLLDNLDVTDALRSPEVSRLASRYAAVPAVRQGLVALQRQLGRQGRVVMEGRDIGTAIFPEATHKFYLDASLDARARRRLEELRVRGVATTLEETRRDLAERDRLDSSRSASPLTRAADAIYVDTTTLARAEVVERLVEEVRGGCGGSAAEAPVEDRASLCTQASGATLAKDSEQVQASGAVPRAASGRTKEESGYP